LPDTDDRIMATKLTATWRYSRPTEFDHSFEAVRRTLLDTFASHESESVQHSIWVIGRAIIESHPEVSEVTMTLPNLHHWLADLSPFGQPNDREIFIATTEPHGLIQATVRAAAEGIG
jgi:urate oxidase